ncbi:ATPase [Streptomyces xanthochromogenes]|uniref:sensor histidine kinase n=1 Tax=Streptomyces xanthochromogenes TaxID=67384 RepID=UPI001679C8E9|nr:nitrate- and nitrite sensing domain-containing protein [Streptomyces xanthochromogenes]GHB34140.1 ATPase [Streptomyces xanthochromogenes]
MRTPRKAPEAEPPTPVGARGRRAHAGPPATDERPLGEPPAPQDAEAVWRMRPRTVRAKIVSLLMVPVVSLLALWGFATVSTAQDVSALRQARRIDEQVRTPLVVAVAALQDERAAAVRYLAAPVADRAADLDQRAKRTDATLAGLRLDRDHTVADAGDVPASAARRLRTFVDRSRKLPALRGSIHDRTADWDAVYQQYTETIGAGFDVDGALAGLQAPALGPDTRVLYEFGRAGEMLAREDALISAAQLAHSFSADHLRRLTGAVDSRRTLTESATADLTGPARTAWTALAGQSAYAALTAAEDKVRTAEPGRAAAGAVDPAAWEAVLGTVRKGMQDTASEGARNATERADPFTRGLLTTGGAAVLFGLAAVAASLVISVRIGRGLVVELISLRNSALEIARRKLPTAMGRLRSGEELDIHAEAPQGPPPRDEIAQVGEALGTVHRAALSAAVERAELASGISGVFVNLARRSQVLVHRQLGLLDRMERRVDDPGELGDLFRLDHLTTRMRRHAESLIILSGAAPGRAWSVPVPLTNVVRAAVSEIEDYARVEVRRLPEAAVTGGAVADLTHLLAELIENAAQFSPPHTKVRVAGEPVGNGYALEIEDRGLGMSDGTLDEANRRIEQSEALDLFDSDRLGLFVVSRLAARHTIKVHLRTSPYGGTTAVVLLPTDVLQKPVEAVAGAAEAASRRDDRPYETPRGPIGTPSATPARPALVAQHAPPAVRPEPPAPPGVTTLRQRARGIAPDGAEDGLPRRVRQASLAPQLREAPAPAPDNGPAVAPPTPEQARDRMAAYMGGWARGGADRRTTPTSAHEQPVGGRTDEGDRA